VKASALILVSFLMGALATVALAKQAQSAGVVSHAGEPRIGRATAIVEPVRTVEPTALLRSTSKHLPARISIPRLRLTAKIGTNLDAGPVWWPVTGRPGGGDTVAIAGHRTTHTHPFLDLDLLEAGDVIDVRWEGITHRYVMSGRRILSSTNRHIADARGHEVLLLTACTPKGSARQRIVIYARPAKSH
jgi:LPXTG-site transpeptidase (sortase) family protein